MSLPEVCFGGNRNYTTFAEIKETTEGNGFVPFFHSDHGQRNNKDGRKYGAGVAGR
jgi:hypothetical protein